MNLSALILFPLLALAMENGGDGGGTVIKNGGDTIRCTQSASSPFSGLYSLDYILMFNPNIPDEMVEVKTWEQSKNRILSLVRKNCSRAGYFEASLQNFYDLQGNEADWTKFYIWRPSVYGLVDIQDERMSRLVPPNCKKPDGRPDIIQSVIRHADNDRPVEQIVFDYDPEILNGLKLNSPLQYSFLIHHEYLWNVVRDANKLRWMNGFLHSRRAEQASPEEFNRALSSFGVYPSSFCF